MPKTVTKEPTDFPENILPQLSTPSPQGPPEGNQWLHEMGISVPEPCIVVPNNALPHSITVTPTLQVNSSVLYINWHLSCPSQTSKLMILAEPCV